MTVRQAWTLAGLLAAACPVLPAAAQGVPAAPSVPAPAARAGGDLPAVTVRSRADEAQVEKSYRRMLRGVELFERERALAPQATLRFRLLPRKRDTDLRHLALYLLGRTVEVPVPVAEDNTFAFIRHEGAWRENATVTPDRRAGSLTWRAEIRTPGLPPGTRRLGDLRLECRVGMAAGLVSANPTWITQVFNDLSDSPAYCDRPGNRYLFFADRPLFGVTLVDGPRRERLPVERLWGAALGEPRLAEVLPVCDCEVLLDRAYFAPLEDRRWSDETRVVFEFMEDPGAPR